MAGYVAAAAMLSYLAVKCVWVVAAAGFGDRPDDWSTEGWVALNLVTVVMAVAGAGLGLALARDWHRALPGRLVAALGWLVAGFLVSLLPWIAVAAVVDVARDGGATGRAAEASDSAVLPAWEAVLLTFGFTGTAVGVAVGLPVYVWRRWLAGATWAPGRRGGLPHDPATLLGAVSAVTLGGWWIAWALHGGLGGHLHDAPADARLLEGTLGCWAVAAGLIVLRPPNRTSAAALNGALAAAFIGSGSLFAWSAWRLPFDVIGPPGFEAVAAAPMAVAHHLAGAAAGLLVLRRLAATAPLPITDQERDRAAC